MIKYAQWWWCDDNDDVQMLINFWSRVRMTGWWMVRVREEDHGFFKLYKRFSSVQPHQQQKQIFFTVMFYANGECTVLRFVHVNSIMFL